MMRLLIGISLALILAPAHPLSAQQRYAAAVGTESNNQHKIVWQGGQLYVTYTRVVRSVPQVFVDVSTDGRTWRSLGQASPGPGPATLSTLAVDGQGRVHVAWTDFSTGAGAVHYRLYAGGWHRPVTLSSPLPYAGYPSLDVDRNNQLHLAWYGIREASQGQPSAHGGIYEIYYLRHDSGWSRMLRLSGGFPDAVNPALAVDAAGRPHVVWFQSDGQAFQITYTRRHGEWRTPEALTSGPAPSTKPAIAVDATGRIHLAWERLRGGKVVIQYMRGEGDRWSAPLEISGGAGRHPTVGLWAKGVLALWQEEDGSIALRAFDGTWRSVKRLGKGDYPNATPWRPMPGARPFAAWTTATGIQVLDLEPLLARP